MQPTAEERVIFLGCSTLDESNTLLHAAPITMLHNTP